MKFQNYKIVVLLILIVSCSDSKNPEKNTTNTTSISSVKSYTNKTLQVYTTTKDTELRLTKTSEQTFKNKAQPLETEIAV